MRHGKKRIVLLFTSFTVLLTACGKEQDQPQFRLSNADSHVTCDDAERDFQPRYLHLAKGPVTAEALESLKSKRLRWPFNPLSIGHSTASYQNYGGAPYFHHGLDIRQDAGVEVQAVAGGEVVNIENYMPSDAYWEVAIKDDDGYLWQYHHLDRTSIPESVWQAFRSHSKIDAGSRLGEIYYWDVSTFGERYHHLHLNVLGEGGVYLNPFSFLEDLDDSSAPQFARIGLLKNGRAVNGSAVSGDYSIFATIHDLILHEKFFVPPHEIRFSVDKGEEHLVWNFDTLPEAIIVKPRFTNFLFRRKPAVIISVANLALILISLKMQLIVSVFQDRRALIVSALLLVILAVTRQ